MSFDTLSVLKELVAFPSVSADSQFKRGLAGARDYLEDKLQSIGFAVEVIETPVHPLLLAERRVNPHAPTVVIYGHYDVQPPDPLDLWDSEPFVAEVRGNRVFGRGAADNKGPVAVYLAVLSDLLEEEPDLDLNLVVLLEGEEEIGSPSFKPVLKKYADRIRGDFVLACDTGSQREDQLTVTTGLRGITCLEVRLKGPGRDLHSGVFGGPVLNPLQALAEICSSLHHPDGTVNVAGFYDEVIEPEDWERREISRIDRSLEDLGKLLGVNDFHTTPGFDAFEAIRLAPTLEFNGMGGGYQGEGSKTVIPREAFVKISCRLVANQDAGRIQQQVVQTIRDRCPPQVELEILKQHNGNPYRVVPPGKPHAPKNQNKFLARAFETTETLSQSLFGRTPLFLREGGSIPIIADIKEVLDMDTLLIGLYLPDDNAHAPNESFHLGMMEKGKKLLQGILRSLPEGRRFAPEERGKSGE